MFMFACIVIVLNYQEVKPTRGYSYVRLNKNFLFVHIKMYYRTTSSRDLSAINVHALIMWCTGAFDG